jgi:hypothetical protein
MADDVTPPGMSVPIVTDELAGGRQLQIVKNAFGADGVMTVVDDPTPLPTSGRVYFPTAPRLTQVAINVAASGDNALVTGTAAQTIRVFKVWLVALAAVSIKFRDGTTDLHPAIPLAAGGAMILDLDGEPWFTTTAAAALNLNLSTAVQVSGRLYYVKG